MAMNYNAYMPNMQPKTPQQLQAELQAMLQGQYAPIYNAFQQQNMNMPQQSPNQPSTNGMYIFVNDYSEVENYPVPADGRAVLIFINGQNVYYSKKLVNGQPMLQAFNYMPINMNGSVDNTNNTNNVNTANTATQDEKSQSFEDKILTAVQSLSDRITQLETTKPKQKSKKETAEVDDGL